MSDKGPHFSTTYGFSLMQKKSHGMLWTTSGRKILSVQVTLTFAAMNI
jgi:hypothetical protein